MKREFGKKLINEYFGGQVELDEVIDTSGAYIPGHGTPTVVLVGRNRYVSPRYSGTIRTVLGVRGEPSQPDDPASGLVWTAILDQIDKPGSESEWISAADFARDQLATHPWSLSGGGSADLLGALQRASGRRLRDTDAVPAIYSYTGDDEVFIARSAQPRAWLRHEPGRRPYVVGEDVRDWHTTAGQILWPYQGTSAITGFQTTEVFWPFRTGLRAGLMFGKTREQRGILWNCLNLVSWSCEAADHLICFADVATHNHFAYVVRGVAFNQHAPVIKLPEGATEDDHLRLLGVLNSSTACFWLKQVSHNKGSTVDQRGARQTTVPWENFYEFTGTKLQEFPLPGVYPLERSRALDDLAQRLAELTPAAIAGSGVPTRERLAAAQAEYDSVRAQMNALQEELDWEVYGLYGLRDEELTTANPPEVRLGERAFEIVLARKMKHGEVDTQWFARHRSTPITDIPAHWPDDYKRLVQRRIEIIESDRNIALVERTECKRRWASEGWEAMQQRALRDWLLDRLESPALWGGDPVPMSVAQLADRVRHDVDFRAVLDLWVGTDQHDLTKTLGKLVADECVPFLPADRYKPSGLRKRAQWERTWALQRREDAGEKLEIAVPPKYTSADFAKSSYWRNRGKLDVPKERFISYPRMGRDGDPTELIGWAGWDHLAQARALAAVYLDRKTQAGWLADRLLPLLAGLAELEPWLKQWHGEPVAGYSGTPAEFFSSLIDTELAYLGADRSTLAKLRGVEELA